ncbi:MAG: hypothetical protein C4B58_06900 [Deltaproteobacteria bacterium]|nr:MAG: hypothetical protein C4B58_06900 [Deltaproteobacteria bacterium]
MHANGLSIFEADESYELIRCSATTGLQGDPPLPHVVYRAGDGVTGTVFKTNKPVLYANVRKTKTFQGLSEEKRSIDPTKDRDPFVAVPIPGPKKNQASGVIRALERTCHVNPRLLQNFSSFDLDILRLIATQVSPIFQMIKLQSYRERFVERTAHQLIQPLQGVVAYSSNIVDGVYGSAELEKIDEKLRYIRAMARSAASMMRSCMWASGITDFSFLRNIGRSQKPLNRWIIERIIDLQPIRMHEDIKIRYLDDENIEDSVQFAVDDLYFEQALQNVLHNAVKDSYPNTTVKVHAFKQARSLEVIIQSTGIPILPQERQRIFKDRQRGTTAEKYDKIGTGQDLYIAKRIMKGFRGDVVLAEKPWADNSVTPPKGFPKAQVNEFILTLPEAFYERDHIVPRR